MRSWKSVWRCSSATARPSRADRCRNVAQRASRYRGKGGLYDDSEGGDRTVEALNKLLIMEDAEIVDRSADFGVLAVVGSEARRVLEGWSGAPLDLTVPYADHAVG